MSHKKLNENKQEESVNSLRVAYGSLMLENQQLKIELERLVQSRNELFLQLQKYEGFRRQLRMLIGTTYDRLYRKADTLSYSSNQTFPTQKINIASKRENLLKRITNYDSVVLIEKRVVGPKWRRWTSWFLKKCLSLPKRIIRLMITLIRKLQSKAGSA